MDQGEWNSIIFAMMNAHAHMWRELMRHLVEEGHIESGKAAKIVLEAANAGFPHSESTGESYDLGRESLVALATALLGWTGTPHAPHGPKHDRG